MEVNTNLVVKRLLNIARIVFFMIPKGISKNNKFMLHLHHFMTKPRKLAEKVMGNLMFHHQNHPSPATCRSSSRDTHMSFIIPREYEFSCSNSPANFPIHVSSKRKTNRHRYHTQFPPSSYPTVTSDDLTTSSAVQKMLEMLNNEAESTMNSPILPGFGRSPAVRQLRITDSPFPLKDVNETTHLDEDAEEFIKRFYEQLRMQNYN